MAAYLMAAVTDLAQQMRLALRDPAQHEEGRADAVTLQDVERLEGVRDSPALQRLPLLACERIVRVRVAEVPLQRLP